MSASRRLSQPLLSQASFLLTRCKTTQVQARSSRQTPSLDALRRPDTVDTIVLSVFHCYCSDEYIHELPRSCDYTSLRRNRPRPDYAPGNGRDLLYTKPIPAPVQGRRTSRNDRALRG